MSYEPEQEAGGTTAQNEAIDRAYQTLGEQFDGVLIVVSCEVDDNPNQSANLACWKGGYMTALGLATFAQHKLLNHGNKNNDNGDEEEE